MNPTPFSSSMQNAENGRYVTISVDDGSTGDMKTADLLQKYGLQATFYIPARNPERAVLPASQVRELGGRFEVGSHTFNHAPLKFMSEERASREIVEGKRWLEEVLGEPVISFCYPRGKFNGTTPRLVKKAGFLGARTTLMDLHDFPRNPFLWGVSTLAYPLSKIIHLRHAVLERNFAGIRNFFRDYKAATEWEAHFSCALDYVQEHGGVAHLMMHSWEMEESRTWSKLESVFAAISRRGLTSVTNGDLYRVWSSKQVSPVPVAEPAGGPR